MTFPFRPAAFLLVLAPLAAGASAQQRTDSVHVLGPILVEAERPSMAPRGVRSIRVDRDGLALDDLVTVLEREAGIYALRTGTGAAPAFRIRGTDDLQTAVFLDGIALRDPHTGSIDPDLVPRVVLESAEIGLGAAGSDAGAPTGPGLGGAIRLSSGAAGGCGGTRVEAAAGAYGSLRAGGRVASGSDRLCLLLAAEHGEEAGDFPVPAIPGAPDRRLGASRSHDSGFARISGAGGQLRWSVTGWGSASAAGLPGPSNSSPRGAEMDTDSWRGAASVRRLGARIDMGLSLQAGHSVGTFRDPAANRLERAEATTVQGEFSLAATLSRAWRGESRFVLGLDRSVLPVAGEQRRSVVDVSATSSGDSGVIALGLSAGRWPGAGVQAAPRLSAGTRGGRWSLRASAARAVRPPTLAERTWVPGGNPDLRPETGWSADAGVRFESGTGWAIDLGAYVNHLRDRIVWQPRLVAPGLDVWTPSNVGRSLGLGVEPWVERTLRAGSGRVRMRLAGTIGRTTDRSDPLAASFGHPLRHLPGSTWSALAEWASDRFGLRLDARRIGRRPVASDDSRHLPAFTVLDVSGSLAVGRPLRLRASLRNALGARYAMIPNYPMPGRHLTITLTLDLSRP
jgi:iron complex outermembrane receptor protein